MSSPSNAQHPLVLKADRLALSFRCFANNYKRVVRDNSFWQYRPYQGGDSASLIDWRQSARAEKIYVREKKEEERKSVFLWCDTSTPVLAEEGRVLLLALTRLLLQDSFKVFWITRDANGALAPYPACTSEAAFDAFVARSLLPFTAPDKFPPPFNYPRAAKIVYCSDFQSDPEAWRKIFIQTASGDSCGLLLYLALTSPPQDATPQPPLATLKNLAARSGWHVISHTPDRTLAPETLSTLLTLISEQK